MTRVGRRAVLAALAAGGASLAGRATPAATRRDDGGTGATATGRPSGGLGSDAGDDPEALARLGTPATVCEAEPMADPGIHAVVEPAFGPDWGGVDVPDRYVFGDEPLPDGEAVVGVVAGDRARAYPLSVLWVHEAVNDALGGSLLVTYCAICASGMVASRVVGGEPARFTVSGHLWQPPREYVAGSVATGRAFGAGVSDPDGEVRHGGNVVLVDDATGTFWSQVLARGLCGPLAGVDLDLRPATLATWGEWRRAHPEGEVLLPPPASGTDRP